jgi:hypothetical protein
MHATSVPALLPRQNSWLKVRSVTLHRKHSASLTYLKVSADRYKLEPFNYEQIKTEASVRDAFPRMCTLVASQPRRGSHPEDPSRYISPFARSRM